MMDSSSILHEIQVTDCDHITPQPPIIQSNDIWFQDGTIVLQAETTQFKVYRGILAINSPVFNDMFAVSHPASQDVVDGCALVHLHDKAVDTMHFLKAIHFAGCVSIVLNTLSTLTRTHPTRYYDRNESKDFILIAAVLRLSTKYNVEYLRQRAFHQLSCLYPTTLEAWDHRVDAAIEIFDARPFAVLKLAKETNHPALLPAAMYLCADSEDINVILDGLDSIDGSHVELDWDEKRACIRARQNLLLALRSRIFRFLLGTLDVMGCTTPSSCDSSKFKWLRSLEASLNHGSPGVFSIKFPWSAFCRAVCEVCFSTSQAHSNNQRRALWDELPSFFDLPTWEEIRRAT